LTGLKPIDDKNSDTAIQRAKNGEWNRSALANSESPEPLKSICRKAMSAPIVERYDYVASLKSDIESYLADEPFDAHRDSTMERFTRVFRRYRKLAVSAAAVLTLFAVVSTVAAVLINQQRNLADEAREFAETKRAAAETAQGELEKEKVRREAAFERRLAGDRLLTRLIPFLNPERSDFDEGKALDWLEQVRSDVPDDMPPLARASFLNSISSAYSGVNAHDRALAAIEKSIDIYSVSDDAVADHIEALRYKAKILTDLSRMEEALATIDECVRLTDEHDPDLKKRTQSLSVKASTLVFMGRGEEAKQLLEQLLREYKTEDGLRFTIVQTLGLVKLKMEDARGALELFDSLIEKDPSELDHAQRISRSNALANSVEALYHVGDLERAERNAREQLDYCITNLSKGHQKTIVARNSLSIILMANGKLNDAERCHTENLKYLGEAGRPSDRLASLSNLAAIAELQDDYEEAARRHRDAQVTRRDLDVRDLRGLVSLRNYGLFFSRMGLVRQAAIVAERLFKDCPQDSPAARASNELVALARFANRDYSNFAQLVEQTRMVKQPVFIEEQMIMKPENPPYPVADFMSFAYLKQGDMDRAKVYAEKLVEVDELSAEIISARIEAKSNPKSAIQRLENALESIEPSDSRMNVAQAYSLLAELMLPNDQKKAKE
ncbi:MAG: hypothetical protein AAF394_16455, partial [Planctomycetota bacterium]